MNTPASKSRRGGRRPGAGAPRGNLNALKHGRRSRQFAHIGALLAANPEIQLTLLDLAQRHLNKQLKAEEVAAVWLTRLFEHAHAIARGEESRGPFAYLLEDTTPARGQIKALKDVQSSKRRRSRATANTEQPQSSKKQRNNNQISRTNAEVNQPPDTKSDPESDD